MPSNYEELKNTLRRKASWIKKAAHGFFRVKDAEEMEEAADAIELLQEAIRLGFVSAGRSEDNASKQ